MNTTMLSGNDVVELRAYIEKCQVDPRATGRRSVLGCDPLSGLGTSRSVRGSIASGS